jgi:alkylated DNA nucleotide flippase Atl1
MARRIKTWQEKLARAKANIPTPRRFFCNKSKLNFVVPTVAEIEQLMRRVPRGRLMTIGQMTAVLREKHAVDACCPMTTGIFAWIIAHAADEAERTTGISDVPWWRLLKTGGELNPKYPGARRVQRAKLEGEGHRVVARGKQLVVDGFQGALVGTTNRQPAPRKRAGEGLYRRVLRREDFGLCVLVPKQEWPKLPDAVQVRAEVNGRARRAIVRTERCNCAGKGWHEHRFLSLPRSAGVVEADRVTIRIVPSRPGTRFCASGRSARPGST